ncbi:MAG: response regulator [Magnetococcales bacterium]|nr:response regulator [Magnetococcales bacterium]
MDSIVIVEDSKSFGSLLQRTIADSLEQEIVWVKNYFDAAKLLKRGERFSLAILDLILPDATNGEVVDLFLEHGTPTVVMSGRYSSSLRDRLFAKGILDYFIKDNIQVIDAIIYFINRFRGNKRINVLVVDDSKSARMMLCHFLTIHGFTVFSVSSGAKALDLLVETDIHLVITDYQMPQMDGFALTRKIRANFSRYEVAVIGLSSQGESEVEVQFIKAGANDYLAKPYQKETLSCRISQTVEIIERYREQTGLLQRHRSILDNALDAIITIDDNGKVVSFNPAAEALFGFSENDVMGYEIADFVIPQHLREKHRDALHKYKLNSDRLPNLKRRTEFPGLREDGKMIDLEVSLIATPYQGKLQFTAFLQDITDRKQLLKSLEETLSVAEEASRSKSEFIANTSHEIRTPMNAIIGFTELALKLELSPKLRDYQQKVKNASHTLMGLLDDVLDFSKIEAGRLELDPIPFELNDLFDRLSDLFSIQTADKNIEMILSIPPEFNQTIIGDSQRLEQVLINLIRNAIKFTESGTIVVTAEPKETRPGHIEMFFSVKDSGIGIDPDRLPVLFDAFVQADGSTTRKYGGTGLGLTICKRLVDLMHGKIGAKSNPGEGSTFFFTIPFESRPGEKENRSEIPNFLKGAKVLIAEDNHITREILHHMVESFSMVPTSVESGEAALAEWITNSDSNQQFSLILMDWRMGGMDGITTTKRILEANKKDPDGEKKIPKIIMLTAFGDDDTRQLALKSGIDAFLSKPITRSHLIDSIRENFGHKPVGGDQYAKILAEEAETANKISGSNILLVDDNPINQQVACELLQRVGLEVDLANNGQEALDRLEEKVYDAVLMDVQMPVMDGLQATRLIRQQPRFRQLPIIAMTAHALAEDKRKCRAAGMDEHIAKPIRPERLYAMLSHWLDSISTVKPSSDVDSHYIEFPEIKGLNINDGLGRVMGNRKLYLKLLHRFMEDHINDVNNVGKALEDCEYDQAASLVHSIKGVSSNIGAKNLQYKTEVLEKTIKERVFKAISKAYESFCVAHNELMLAMQPLAAIEEEPDTEDYFVDDDDGDKKPAIDGNKVATLCRELIVLLEDNSVETESILNELTDELASSGESRSMKKLVSKVEQYEFDVAIDIVNTITGNLKVNSRQGTSNG